MKGNILRKKICAVFAAAVLSVSCIFAGGSASADNMSDLEAKQAKLEKERKDIEAMMAEYEGKAEEAEKYLEEYDKKMKLQEEQVAVVEAQIKLYEDDISELQEQITQGEAEVKEGIDQFRQRLRSLYMAGSDSMASVLTGSTDFYDMLARMEFVERVSTHDNQLIDSLNIQITALESSKSQREQKLSELETKKAEEEKYYEELRETYNNHAETKRMHENMVADYEQRADEIEEEQRKVEEELQAEIRRIQEENERKRREEEQRRKEEEERRRKEAEANNTEYVPEPDNTPAGYSETGFIWPVPSVRNMTDGYGNRWIVEEQRNNFHKGIDITKPGCGGTQTVASAAGTVIQASNKWNGYGECVIIDHGNGISTLYAHHQEGSLMVKVGDTVSQGQALGRIGHTGNAYGDHLHFEVRVNGEHTNPLNYVNMNN